MKISSSTLVNVISASVLLTSLFLVATTTSQGQYDPWRDLNDDGWIELMDFYLLSEVVATSGNPAKNVTVINWPVATEVSVWWFNFLDIDESEVSSVFNSSGFGQLHVLAFASELTGSETLPITIRGIMHDPGHTTTAPIAASTFVLTSSSTMKALTIPVPSAEFQFYAETDFATICYVSLSFYLTWG